MRRPDRALHSVDKVGANRDEVDLVTKSDVERIESARGVVTGSVEAAIDGMLDPRTERLEERGAREESAEPRTHHGRHRSQTDTCAGWTVCRTASMRSE